MTEDDVAYEPLRPSQNQIKITQALTGVYVDVEVCAVCSQNRGVGDHHVIFRSHGGTAGPVLPLCPKCHTRIHEGDWEARLVAKGEGKGSIEILGPNDEIVWRLLAWPLEGEPGDFVHLFDTVRSVQQMMPQLAGALLPWQKVEAFRALKSVEEGGWRAQVRLIDEVMHYGTPGLSQGEKVEVVSNLFDIKRAQVYNLKRIAEVYRDTDALERTALTQREYLTAADTVDPEKWVDVAQERKLHDRNFTSDDLREEAIIANEWKPDVNGDMPEPKDKQAYGICPNCRRTGYFKILPIGSDGNPVP